MFNPISVGKNLLKAKKQYDEFTNKMRELRITGHSKGNLVTVVIDGLKQVVDINIVDDLLKDKQQLIKHLKDAYNDASKNLEKNASKLIDKDQAMDMIRGIMGS